MTPWTAPASYTFHFAAAPGAPPHSFDDCDERCAASVRQGWLMWVAEGATVDLDDVRGEPPPGGPLL